MKLLAFDTSTDVMSLAATDGVHVWQLSGPGGAQASSTLIPAILALLAQARLTLDALDAIVFGRGPGSFTGLRTACSVAQGLALGARGGAGLKVLPLDTLMAVAEEARFQWAHSHPDAPLSRITALLDARMDEMYVQAFEFKDGQCAALADCELIRPEHLVVEASTQLLAGNVFGVYADRLPNFPDFPHSPASPAGPAMVPRLTALPAASAMLRLAPALVAAGHCVDADHALPLYIRDKVALTTEERAQVKAQAARASPPV